MAQQFTGYHQEYKMTNSPLTQTTTGYVTENGNVTRGFEFEAGQTIPENTGTVTWTICDPANFPAFYVSPAQAWSAYQATAQAALNKSDLVATRCFKAGVAFPAAWLTYVEALRAIVSASTGTPATLPVPPAYPAGT